VDKPPQSGRILRFGTFEVDRQACELRQSGRRIPLQIQPFRVLEALIDRAGNVVTRAALREKVWPSTVFVDFDHGLNNSINRLRHALGDSAEDPKFIETLPRVGYRFIHALDRSPEDLEPPASRARGPTIRRVAMSGAVVSLLGIGLLASLQPWDRNAPIRGTPAGVQPAATPEAYDAYLRGHALLEQRNKESLARSIEYLTLATTLDPSFALAHAELAEAYVTAGGNTLVSFSRLPKRSSVQCAVATRLGSCRAWRIR
jgi:DNA-binding winged helix-turn-helix (wHTH) protein